MRRRLTAATVLVVLAAIGVGAWVLNVHSVNHWLAVHTGTVDEPGPYYGFWSGFGSDVGEFGIIGALGTTVYQLARKYNCHQPGCWRVGNHAAAGGQFNLCFRHHPDYRGIRPTQELIAHLHHEHRHRDGASVATLEHMNRQAAEEGGADQKAS